MTNAQSSSMTDLDTTGADTAAAAAAAAKAPKGAGSKGADKAQPVLGSGKGKKFDIMIASTESDSSAVKVAINGELTLIPRNTRVLVSQDVMDVLNNAVVDVVNHTSEGTKVTQAPRHSVSVYGTTEA